MIHDRWTQYADDSSRLPEGFKRIGYDADTKRYTFRDGNGVLYRGEPGFEYGEMTPIPLINELVENARPNAFESSGPQTLPPQSDPPPKTFQDILPPNLITTSSQTESNYEGYGKSKSMFHSRSPSSTSANAKATPRDQFVDAVRRSALPKMQGVVHGLRRSVTSMKKSRSGPPAASTSMFRTSGQRGDRDAGYGRLSGDEEEADARRRLVRHDTTDTSTSTDTIRGLERSDTTSTTRTGGSRAVDGRPLSQS